MKMNQIEAWKSIRKQLPPKGRIERPVKGGGYVRNDKFRKDNYESE